MSRTLKCDKICKYVKISDKIFSLKRLKNTRETIKTIKVIKTDFARMESHCLFRVVFSSWIKNISKIRQSNLLWHFF